ncbi:MAG TPA: flavodoxin [Methanocella sp.]|jgi:flavodoxin
MKIGIIVYSQTGNTFSVARKLQEKLSAAGHTVKVERLTTVGGVTDPNKAKIEKLPDLSGYDALAFAGPVQGFSLSHVMANYMNQLPSLQGKKVVCFITKGLPMAMTGGNKAISQLKSACESKGGIVAGTGMVFWGNKGRDNHINEVVEQLARSF